MNLKEQSRVIKLLELKERSIWVTDHIRIMLAYWDEDQICRFANPAYQDWFGPTKEEMIDKMTLKELLGPLYDKNIPLFQEALKGIPQQFERELIIPNGERRFVEIHYFPDKVDNEVRGVIAQVSDITRIKDLEKELLKSEKKFKNLLNNSPDAIIISHGNGEIHFINTQTEILFGYKRREVLGKKIESLFQESTRLPDKVQKSGFSPKTPVGITAIGSQIFGKSKNNRIFPIEITVSPISLEDGIHVIAAIRDITYRKEQEKLVSELALILNSSSDAIFSITLEGRILTWNKGAEAILGYTFEEIKDKNISLLIPKGMETEENILLKKLQKGEILKSFETVRIRKDKKIINVSITFSPILEHNGEIIKISIVLRDITEKKVKEQEKQRIEEILDKTNEIARIGTWEIDLIKTKIHWSRITREIHGVDAKFEPDVEKAIQFFKEGRSRKTIQKSFQDAVNYGTPYDLELEIVTVQGKDVWVRNIGHPEFKNGICHGIYGVFQDIDQVKRSQEILNKTNQELSSVINANQASIISPEKKEIIKPLNKESEKDLKSLLETESHQNNRLKNFTHIISHNLQSHSNHVHHLLEILLESYPDLKEDIVFQHLQTTSINLADTLTNVKEVAKIYLNPPNDLVSIDLNQALEKALANLKELIQKSGIKIINGIDQEFKILGIHSYVDNILFNFITNGVKFRSTDRKSEISFSAISEGKEIILSIQDNGLGIDLKKFANKIFGMYQIFHSHKEAKGVGLFITKNQIEALGGKVEVESEVNKGSLFRVYFKKSE